MSQRQELIPRATLEALLGHRDRALALSLEARAMHLAVLDKVQEAQQAARLAAGGYEHALYKAGDLITSAFADDEKVAANIRAEIDRTIWPAILRMTGLAGMMDKEARDKFDKDLAADPPECTADNIRATFQALRRDSYRIFRRGVVNVFRNLAREYRSHDGFKLGPRTIISYGVGDYREYHAFADADRIMHILDGQRIGDGWYSTLAERLRNEVKTFYKDGNYRTSYAYPGEVTTAYWRAKWFQNKNVHLWCLRPDLLRRANRLIAEEFEEALGEGPDAAGARRYQRPKPYHSTVEDFYPTSAATVQRMVEAAQLEPGMEVLEPSAGEGAIVTGILDAGIRPDCVEIDPDRADTLRDMLPPGSVMCLDFLRMMPEPEYDRVLMNPPFGKGAGVQHVLHAIRFLKPGGRLVAILGAGLEYRQDGPTEELRKLIRAWGGGTERLPPGSFRQAGTEVETVMVTLTKPAGALPALPAPAEDATEQQGSLL